MVTPLKVVFSRSAVTSAISMNAHLCVNPKTGAILGWGVDTWTERGISPVLAPKTHWLPKETGKFLHAICEWDSQVLHPQGEDTYIEPQRKAFILATLPGWEQEYLKEQAAHA